MATLKQKTQTRKKARDAKEYDVMLFDFIEQELTVGKKSSSEEKLDEER